MSGFSRGLLSGVAISGVISALYVRYHQQTASPTTVVSDTSPIVTHTAKPGTPVIPNDFQYKEKLKYSDDDAYLLRGNHILKHGMPKMGTTLRFYGNHVLQYDQFKKIPLWVGEHITDRHVKGGANRRYSKFKPDPHISAKFSAENSDYWNSGWSRGHMAPAGNNKFNQDAMDHTFYLSNVLPQNYENNAGFWNRLEIYCRDLTSKFKDVWVVSGPLMVSTEENGKRYIKYEVIGKSEVAVPTHLYKVIVVGQKKDGSDSESEHSVPAVAAFIVPNKPLSYDHKLKQFQVPLDQLESKTGIEFLSKVDRSTAPDLCSVDDCELMGREQFELYFLTRRVQSANSLHKLEKVWSELETKGLTPDDHLKDLYNKKLKELSDKKSETE